MYFALGIAGGRQMCLTEHSPRVTRITRNDHKLEMACSYITAGVCTCPSWHAGHSNLPAEEHLGSANNILDLFVVISCFTRILTPPILEPIVWSISLCVGSNRRTTRLDNILLVLTSSTINSSVSKCSPLPRRNRRNVLPREIVKR